MEFDDAFQVIDNAIVSQAGRHLSAPEVTLLRGTWQGMTYDQMADNSQYSLNYLMRDVGPKFWRLLSSALGKEVSKTNIRLLMEQQNGVPSALLHGQPLSSKKAGRLPKAQSLQTMMQNHVWDVMPEVPLFCGRDRELESLTQWTIDDQVQLISISGLSGVGKTALARLFVDEVQESFEFVLWRSIAHGPSLIDFIQNIFRSLDRSLNPMENPISQLMALLQSHRCLVILDSVEGILDSEKTAGQYRLGFENYGELFGRLSDVSHQSCLILSGLEIPYEILLHNNEAIAVRNMSLAGLQPQDATALLESERLDDPERWPELIRRYSGYPGCLTAASNLSHTLFNGKVGAFLSHQTFVFGEVSRQLDRSFERLSALEKEILFFLGLQGESLSFAEIEADFPISISGRELLEILASLKARALLVTPEDHEQSLFGLSSLVQEYITGILIQTIGGKSTSPTPTPHESLKATDHEEVIDLSGAKTPEPTKLMDWFHQRYPSCWESFSVLLKEPAQLTVRLRSTYHLRSVDMAKRFKRILLGDGDSAIPLALLVSVSQESHHKVGVRLQIQSLSQAGVLPERLSLSLLNSTGESLKTLTTQANEHYIRLPFFRGDEHESFTIQVNWKKHQVQESFVI